MTASPFPAAFGDLLAEQDGVLTTGSALRYLSPKTLRWRIESGRWQQPCHGLIVTQSGPLTEKQHIWVASLWAGRGSAIGGLTAARLGGLKGFRDEDEPICVIRPSGRAVRETRPPLRIVLHCSRQLGEADIHPTLRPPRTRIARSLIDAAAWRRTDRGTQALLAAGVQQGLALPEHLTAVLDRNSQVHRRRLMLATIGDISGGSRALSELDFLNFVIRPFGLPPPDRQVARCDAHGKRRWLDAVWEKARLIVEVDGAGHLEVMQYWDDMDRDNDLKLQGYTTLRYPAFAVRYCSAHVASQISQALHNDGLRCPQRGIRLQFAPCCGRILQAFALDRCAWPGRGPGRGHAVASSDHA
ncbi:MAG TPA: DUF559 domain-containing protein [Trebonia sp.]|jgi:hypothetical protein|nr:DUF559 domain-containing protein [Trebonia sp.]